MNTGFNFFYGLAHRSDGLDRVIVFFADTFPYIVIALAFGFLLYHKEVFAKEQPLRAYAQKWWEILTVFICSGIAWVIARLLKIVINTERPFDSMPGVEALLADASASFPSGHATFFAALAMFIFFYHPRVGGFFMACAVIIGVARVAAGVHFPMDILGGFALGALIAYFCKKL